MNSISGRGKRQGFINKFLSFFLIAAVLGTVGSLVYFIAVPKTSETFTEFYLLGTEDKAIGYPNELEADEYGAKVIVGVVNREQETVTYRVEIYVDETFHRQIDQIVLDDKGSWEQEVVFAPDQLRDRDKIEFFLYKQEQAEAYQSLYLWIR